MTIKQLLRLTAAATLALPLLAACGDDSQTTETKPAATEPTGTAGTTATPPTVTDPAARTGAAEPADEDTEDGLVPPEPEVGMGGQAEQKPGTTTAAPAATDPAAPAVESVDEAIKETEEAIETVPEKPAENRQ